MERIVYPGSFRPFHNRHLEIVRSIVSDFPSGELTLVLSERNRQGGKNINANEAFILANLALSEAGLSTVGIKLMSPNPIKFICYLNHEKISKVYTGSNRTNTLLAVARSLGLWNGEVYNLPNSGLHASTIRRQIEVGDNDWSLNLLANESDYLRKILCSR